MSSSSRVDTEKMLRTATKVWALLLVKMTFISVEEKYFRKYVTDAVVSVHDCYAGLILNDGHVCLLGAPTELYRG